MFPSRYTVGQSSSSAVRKSRVEAKPSMLPKPRRPGSTDRGSTEARRPSAQRSSSAEPPRATLGGRLSREASATKIPINRRSHSQSGQRYGPATTTPLRSSQFRATTTPIRTPSQDRLGRTWQASVERALAFVTIKDQRPIANVSWQRAEFARVQAALAARAERGEGGAGAPALIRPLTIARFVEIVGTLLGAITRDVKLNNDNYVAKLPNIAKRWLYPGGVSKSWLKTVNTLHAFPQALALIGYFLDLVNHIETPVSDEWLYLEKDELACLRRDYLVKCWIRFQAPEADFEDLNAEYLQQLKQLLGDDEAKIGELREAIQKCEAALEDESELAARAEEERARARRDALADKVRGVRAERRGLRARADEQLARRADQASALRALDADIADATAETQQLKKELEEQSMSVAERAQLLGEAEYAARVVDSKRTLAEQISKMALHKEEELAQWQKRTLDSCVQYKQALIHLSAQFPQLAALAVDEKELMEAKCAEAVARALDTLRAHAQLLGEQRTEQARARAHHCRQRSAQLEEAHAKLAELKASVEREQRALEADTGRESADAAAWATERQALAARLQQLQASQEEHDKARSELHFWESQELAWRSKLAEMDEYITQLRDDVKRDSEIEKRKRAELVKSIVAEWSQRLEA